MVIDNFSEFGWTIPLKNKNAQTITNSSEKILLSSKRESRLVESDRGTELSNNNFQNFLNNNNIKLYSGNTSLGAVFSQRFNRTIRDLLKKLVFEKGESSWLMFYQH